MFWMLVRNQGLVTPGRRGLPPLHRHQLQTVVPVQLQHVPLLVLQLHPVLRAPRHVHVSPARRPQGVLLPAVQYDGLRYHVHLPVPGGSHDGTVHTLEHHSGVCGADFLVGVHDGEVPAVVADLGGDLDDGAVLHLDENRAFRGVGGLFHDTDDLRQTFLLHQDLLPQRRLLPVEPRAVAAHARAVAPVLLLEAEHRRLHGQHFLAGVRVDLQRISSIRQLVLHQLVLHPPSTRQPPQRLEDLIPHGLRSRGFRQRPVVRLVLVLVVLVRLGPCRFACLRQAAVPPAVVRVVVRRVAPAPTPAPHPLRGLLHQRRLGPFLVLVLVLLGGPRGQDRLHGDLPAVDLHLVVGDLGLQLLLVALHAPLVQLGVLVPKLTAAHLLPPGLTGLRVEQHGAPGPGLRPMDSQLAQALPVHGGQGVHALVVEAGNEGKRRPVPQCTPSLVHRRVRRIPHISTLAGLPILSHTDHKPGVLLRGGGLQVSSGNTLRCVRLQLVHLGPDVPRPSLLTGGDLLVLLAAVGIRAVRQARHHAVEPQREVLLPGREGVLRGGEPLGVAVVPDVGQGIPVGRAKNRPHRRGNGSVPLPDVELASTSNRAHAGGEIVGAPEQRISNNSLHPGVGSGKIPLPVVVIEHRLREVGHPPLHEVAHVT
mmetsp:Transcript_22914/g.58705  ORF Transcript_22914/g.58705 Transcript_22914/m.58705 type:complete len:649 (-) Transcript_22914:1006-2952(-)